MGIASIMRFLLLFALFVLAVLVGMIWWYVRTAEEAPPAASANSATLPDPDSMAETRRDQLERLEEHYAQGNLTEAEYQRERRKITSSE